MPKQKRPCLLCFIINSTYGLIVVLSFETVLPIVIAREAHLCRAPLAVVSKKAILVDPVPPGDAVIVDGCQLLVVKVRWDKAVRQQELAEVRLDFVAVSIFVALGARFN